MTLPRHEYRTGNPTGDPTLWRLLRITLGPLVWALHLMVSYAAAAIWCAKIWCAEIWCAEIWCAEIWCAESGTSVIDPLLTALLTISATALALLAALGWTFWRQYRNDANEDRPTDRSRYRFLGHVALLLTLVSAIGVVYDTLPAVFAGTCR
ncbi:hypothetical protein [Paragemmobacter aquarius]|uniref:hypothetical protein n=1 Tax=Paragemmobacter aquarius TaxID=2169400 RepID=UPI00131F1574|nr:hypothetical protein [Gemmobacter aquarius]